MKRQRTFYVVYSYQREPGGGTVTGSSHVAHACDKLTNYDITRMRETIAGDLAVNPDAMVITFFAELEG